jgi:hypothetical protein
MTPARFYRIEAAIVMVLFAASFSISCLAMRVFRGNGIQPSFYQSNFEPAVMMSCGRGFTSATSGTVPSELLDFLQLKRNDFDCSLLPESLPRGPVTWNAPWYYLYGTTAVFWRVSGISWTALDVLVSLFCGVATAALYGLFRLVAARWIAVLVTLLLTVSPANLTHLLSLRDYSKAPFVLVAVWLLAVLVVKPMRASLLFGWVALYGAVVGFGWGFRSDLTVMVPFGVLVVLFLLPGALRAHARRNGLAAVLLIVVFLVVSWPALRGLKKGGCQFHYALLGLTAPLTTALGMGPVPYSFGGHFLDTFVDLKVGDYAERVLGQPVPVLCAPEYDTASGQLFAQMATTFPADLVAHAYGSSLMILRAGLSIPALAQPAPPFPSSRLSARVYWRLNQLTELVSPIGPLLAVAAIAAAWAQSARLGIALTAFVLFLTGYPAIEFEERHWFHLRFIPWWAALMLGGQLLQHGLRGWPRAALIRAAAGIAGLLVVLVSSLAVLRLVQARTAGSLVSRYEAARTEELAVDRSMAPILRVDWQPLDYARPPAHRGSDLLVVSLDSSQCVGVEPLALEVRYDADVPSHDLSTLTQVTRPKPADAPTRVFVPVYWQGFQDQTYLRFSGLRMVGAPAACIGRVARVADRASLPLWIELQAPADRAAQKLYQSIRAPRLLSRLLTGPLL